LIGNENVEHEILAEERDGFHDLQGSGELNNEETKEPRGLKSALRSFVVQSSNEKGDGLGPSP
jgi:hypothetical protein